MSDKTALHKAVAAVMAEVHSLKKDEKNNHGSYNYVSVDSFKNLVRPLMAKHGLSLLVNETAFELVPIQGRNGVTMNAKITYALQLRHESGAEDTPEHATVVLPLTGAQTAGAAKSYVIKEYLKGRFLVSTGDKDLIVGGADADAYAPQEYTTPDKQPEQTDPLEAPKRYDHNPIVRRECDRLIKGIRQIEQQGILEDLAVYWDANQQNIADLPAAYKKEVQTAKDEAKAALSVKVAA